MLSSLTIAIPAYNEELTLPSIIKEALDIGKYPQKFELLLVDDGSTDTTGRIMDKFSKLHTNITVLHHNKNLVLPSNTQLL